MTGMLTESEALAHVLGRITPLPSRRVALPEALDAFAMRPVHAVVPLPGFDNSAMDGYAVRAADTRTQAALRVTGAIAAGGSEEAKLEPGCAIRIFTGAPMPPGADAVIMQEDVSTSDEGAMIRCNEPVEQGENVRLSGCDLCVGQKILEAGDKLTAARLAALASQGLAETEVSAAPRVAILTTGDELIAPGQPLRKGQLFNSNATLLQALVHRYCRSGEVMAHHVPDDLAKTSDTLHDVIAAHDFVILSGGVSVGEHDYVKPALESLGIPAEFWQVKIKPGKPFLFAKANQEERPCHVFGLPGNPVSSFVTFQLFVRPALLKAVGASGRGLEFLQAPAKAVSPLANLGNRPHYVRGRYETGTFTATGVQQSHALFSLSQANAMVRMEAGEEIEAGGEVTALLCD
jgi:molybdopterin molybdotransferase